MGGGFCAIDDPEIRKHIIVVGAIEEDKPNNGYNIASYSNYGEKIDIVVLGSNIYSSDSYITWLSKRTESFLGINICVFIGKTS